MISSRLSVGEFAFPGPLRDQLVAAILSGAKTTTSGLLIGYERDRENCSHLAADLDRRRPAEGSPLDHE